MSIQSAVNQLVMQFGVIYCQLSCKFSYFVASRTFMADGLDCRHNTIGRLDSILRKFHSSTLALLIPSHFSWGLVKGWVARISQWSEDCWAGHHEGTDYLLPEERKKKRRKKTKFRWEKYESGGKREKTEEKGRKIVLSWRGVVCI